MRVPSEVARRVLHACGGNRKTVVGRPSESHAHGTAHLSENGETLSQIHESSQNDRLAVQMAETRLHWYAVRTLPRHEKRVHEDLKKCSIECFLPLYEAVHRWKNGCVARVELPVFPGYIFVEIDPRDRFRVLGRRGTVSFVGSQREPWPLPDSDIQSLRTSVGLRKFEPHPYLSAGQKVRIKSGPLGGLTGFLVRKSGGLRVIVSVDLIRQAVAVEVDVDDVECMGSTSSPLPS